MNQQDKQRRRAVRRIFVETDPADLGFGGRKCRSIKPVQFS